MSPSKFHYVTTLPTRNGHMIWIPVNPGVSKKLDGRSMCPKSEAWGNLRHLNIKSLSMHPVARKVLVNHGHGEPVDHRWFTLIPNVNLRGQALLRSEATREQRVSAQALMYVVMIHGWHDATSKWHPYLRFSAYSLLQYMLGWVALHWPKYLKSTCIPFAFESRCCMISHDFAKIPALPFHFHNIHVYNY